LAGVEVVDFVLNGLAVVKQSVPGEFVVLLPFQTLEDLLLGLVETLAVVVPAVFEETGDIGIDEFFLLLILFSQGLLGGCSLS